MTLVQRLGMIAAAGLALATAAGCGPSSPPSAPPQPAAAPNPAVARLTAPDAAAALLPPMADPDHDDRPGGAKSEDFAAHLERIEANMAAVDAVFIGRARSAMQGGSSAAAEQLLADYRSLIAADTAALPEPPHLTGCFTAAAAPNVKAEAAVAAMLSDRRNKADAIAAITDRPLTLPDFGGLATDIATDAGVDDARASLAVARASVAGCHAATGGAPERRRVTAPQPASPAGSPPSALAPPPKPSARFGRSFGPS